MKKLTIIAVVVAIIFSFTSTCFATNTTTGNTPNVRTDTTTTTENDTTRTSSITDNNTTVVTPRTNDNVTTTNDGTMIINDTTETNPVDTVRDTVRDTVVDDTRDVVDTTTDVVTDTVDSMDNGRLWTIIIAAVAILVIIGICIYYMTIPKTNK